MDNQELLRQFDELTEKRKVIDLKVAALIAEDNKLREAQIRLMELAGIDASGIPRDTPRKADGTRY